ncbi:hypothetical protein ZWY2020_013660 [Hordeum vulgare]|nr:hypothetical protein ZWY2020_013660 [Hordeum vulgare]
MPPRARANRKSDRCAWPHCAGMVVRGQGVVTARAQQVVVTAAQRMREMERPGWMVGAALRQRAWTHAGAQGRVGHRCAVGHHDRVLSDLRLTEPPDFPAPEGVLGRWLLRRAPPTVGRRTGRATAARLGGARRVAGRATLSLPPLCLALRAS